MLYLGGDDYHPLQHNSYQNMQVNEIAEALSLAPSSVSGRLKRAKDKLRIALKGAYFDE